MKFEDDLNILADKSCCYYVTEVKNGDFAYCNDNNGFCFLKDFFTPCDGKCEDYDERTEIPKM